MNVVPPTFASSPRPGPKPEAQREVLYVADPLCTWCWGFAPVSDELARAVAGRASVRVVAGGLALNPTAPLHPGEIGAMLDEWHRVHDATGQAFDFDHPVDTATVYDSGPACRALALMGRLHAECALAYLHALQRAFFAQRRDVGSNAVLATVAGECGITVAEFARALSSAEADEAFNADLMLSQALNLRSFPSVALRHEQRYALLTVGYRPWSQLAPYVQGWLEHE